jgi:outer membrane protein OmpA-like peptidoglycan-associated protein
MATQNRRTPLLLTATLVAVLAALPAFAADGDKSTIKGLITAVDGNRVTVKDTNNVEHVITLTSETTYKKTKGLTGVVHEKVESTALMPGLPITADLVAQGSDFNATGISFKSEDFRTAQQVQAGIAPTQARMDDFGTYEALETVEVHFASGSTTISAKDQASLRAFADKAKNTNGYHVVLQGFTDATGNAAANQRLSTMRAASVSNFLQQQTGLMPGRVHAGDGMGVASDAGSGSNANARKVVVKLVVDKGVQAGNK